MKTEQISQLEMSEARIMNQREKIKIYIAAFNLLDLETDSMKGVGYEAAQRKKALDYLKEGLHKEIVKGREIMDELERQHYLLVKSLNQASLESLGNFKRAVKKHLSDEKAQKNSASKK